MREQPWIGVDLDGTLARYDGWVSTTHIGKPIKPMVKRVRRWLRAGVRVKIVTARAAHQPGRDEGLRAIRKWCAKHIGQPLEITCCKDFAMIELWDDRCVAVQFNSGNVLGGTTRTKNLRELAQPYTKGKKRASLARRNGGLNGS